MKNNLLLITGLLLLPALTPVNAWAAATDGDFSCDTVLKLEPVSPYAKQVMTRAEDGITYATKESQRQNFASFLPAWALSITSAWGSLTDTAIQRTARAQELDSVSACLHLDLTMIDCEINKVRLFETQPNGSTYISPVYLNALLQFLSDRRNQLTLGALDPTYPDPTWGNRFVFDPPGTVWCASDASNNICKQISSADCTTVSGKAYQTLAACVRGGALGPSGSPVDDGRMCPFSADYAPASDTGFGCDISLLKTRAAYAPVNAELQGLQSISGALATYRATAVGAMKLQQQLNGLFGQESSSAPPQQTFRPHVNAFGCGWSGGWCSSDHSKRCAVDADCGSQNATCEFSNKLCDSNRAIRCTDDSQCGSNGPCVDASEPPLRSLRGNFSLDRDQLSILNSFLGTRTEAEISRVFRKELQLASDLPANDPKLEQRAADDANPLTAASLKGYRLLVQGWSRVQAIAESLMYPQDVDSTLETAHALGDLHTNISEIARFASDKTGLRDFVTRYAWFLRRSCIYRSCSQLLDQTIKIGTTDECFPYANGQYLNDDPDNPRWQKCKDAAKIDQ